MNINIKATNFKLTEAIKNYIYDKLEDIEKFIRNIDSNKINVQVEVGKINKHHKKGNLFRAEFNFMIPGNYIRAEAEDLNLNAAIDKTKNNIQRKLEKFQHIREAKFKRGARKTKSLKNLL